MEDLTEIRAVLAALGHGGIDVVPVRRQYDPRQVRSKVVCTCGWVSRPFANTATATAIATKHLKGAYRAWIAAGRPALASEDNRPANVG